MNAKQPFPALTFTLAFIDSGKENEKKMHSAFAEDFSEQSALTCGLCRSVVNMMIEYARTYAVSALANSVCLRREIETNSD